MTTLQADWRALSYLGTTSTSRPSAASYSDVHMSSTTASVLDQESTSLYINLLDMSFDKAGLHLPCELIIHLRDSKKIDSLWRQWYIQANISLSVMQCPHRQSLYIWYILKVLECALSEMEHSTRTCAHSGRRLSRIFPRAYNSQLARIQGLSECTIHDRFYLCRAESSLYS